MDQNYRMNQWEIACTIDEVSMDLDNKNLDKALEAFSEDANLTIMEGDTVTAKAAGKEEIKNIIADRMNNMDVIFHNNGTKVIDVKTLDQAAVADTTCIARLIQKEPAAKIDQYQIFEDKLIKVNDYWYIVDRTIRIVSRSIYL